MTLTISIFESKDIMSGLLSVKWLIKLSLVKIIDSSLFIGLIFESSHVSIELSFDAAVGTNECYLVKSFQIRYLQAAFKSISKRIIKNVLIVQWCDTWNHLNMTLQCLLGHVTDQNCIPRKQSQSL